MTQAWYEGLPALGQRFHAAWGEIRSPRRLSATMIPSAETWYNAHIEDALIAAQIPSSEHWYQAGLVYPQTIQEPQQIPTSEHWYQALVGLGHTIQAAMIATAESWYHAALKLNLKAAQIASVEAWYQAAVKGIYKLQAAQIPSSETWYSATISSPITYVGGTSAAANTATVPGTYKAGDLIMVWAFRDGSTTVPTVDANYSTMLSLGQNSCSAVLATRWATSNAEAAPVFTNATGIIVEVYRNVWCIGNGSIVSGSSATVSYPAYSYADVDTANPPWTTAFGAHRQVNGTMNNAPANMVNRVALEGASTSVGDMASFDTNGPFAGTGTGFAAESVTTTESSSGYMCATLELIPYNATAIQNTNLTNRPMPAGKSARLTMRGAGGAGGGANKPSSGGWGAGAGGGGAWVKQIVIPPASLGSTFSLTQGFAGAGGTNSGTAGADGGDSVFVSGSTTLTAGGGKGGHAGGSSGDSAGGAGGLVSGQGTFSYAELENGGAGGNGSRTAGVAGSPGGGTTHAGPGGGGGGCNSSTASAGGAGGSSASTAGGAGGASAGASGASPANAPTPDPGGGGGGGYANTSTGTAGAGGKGSTSGAGGGGSGGKEGTFGNGNSGGGAGDGYVLLEII